MRPTPLRWFLAALPAGTSEPLSLLGGRWGCLPARYLPPARRRYMNGDFYEGSWKADKAHGFGKYSYASGDRCDTVPSGDTIPRGILCRAIFHAVWDTLPRGASVRCGTHTIAAAAYRHPYTHADPCAPLHARAPAAAVMGPGSRMRRSYEGQWVNGKRVGARSTFFFKDGDRCAARW